MGRKNNRAIRPQARRRDDGLPVRARIAPTPIEELVIPRGRCFYRTRNGKLRFTRNEVDRALAQAQLARARKGSGHREERYYECNEPGGCGDFHLTSRVDYVERGKA